MAVALIVAAGRGERLGSSGPKALVHVAGRPMLEWSVTALQSVAAVERIVVALPADRLDAAPLGTIGVPGGETRSQSVSAALGAAGEGDVVLVHYAARALVTPQLLSDAIEEFERSGADAVIAAVPVTDTIKEVADYPQLRVSRTLDRSRLWAVQTPQVFRRSVLERVLTAPPELLARATDDAWLIEQEGGTVTVLHADPENFKITTALDLRLAELMLAERLPR